jgi:hypothetical protein
VTDLSEVLDQWAGIEAPVLLHALRWGFDYEAIAYRLRHDGQFAMEMRLCKEWKIPHSQFLKWKPQDQAKALGHMVFEAQRCSECGIHPNDWPDPDEPDWEVAVKVCPGCDVMAKWQRWANERAEDAGSKDAADGVKPYLRRRED